MTKITVYEKTTCTTCRNVSKILLEKGISYDKINYYISPFTKKKLKELLKKMDIPAAELLRKNEKIYKDLDLKDKKLQGR
jgi:arsenate reductase (glutaredoxin)